MKFPTEEPHGTSASKRKKIKKTNEGNSVRNFSATD